MKKAKPLWSMGALLLTMALFAGMLSVVGVLPAAATTETPSVFEADFSEMGGG